MPENVEYLWEISGELTTMTPLLIGNGGEDERRAPGSGVNITVATAATTWSSVANDMVAAIPGTSLKGAMRSAAGVAVDERIFGSEKGSGLVVFGDSPAIEAQVDGEGESWDAQRRVCIRASTAVDDRLGVADEHKLYYFEYVPKSVTFRIKLTGKSYDRDGQRYADVEAGLKPGLAALGSGRPALGGARQNGWGAFQWKPMYPVVRRLPASELTNWLREPVLNGERRSIFEHLSKQAPAPIQLGQTLKTNNKVSVTVALEMEGALLVNDAWRTGDHKSGKPSHATLRHSKKAFVPEKSMRGVLRHQAERILRTLGAEVEEEVDIRGRDDREKLRGKLSHALFGAAGWRAPFEVSEFIARGDSEPSRQEFIAIDRFTGGGVEKRKFNAEGARGIALQGQLKVDLKRLAEAGGGLESLGLLALVLRDLAEGDVTLGWGAARGYGMVKKMTIGLDASPEWASLPDAWKQALTVEDYALVTGRGEWSEKRAVIGKWVKALNQQIAAARHEEAK